MPKTKLKICHISADAPKIIVDYIINAGYEIKYVYRKINSEIGNHPDIYMCKLGVYDDSPIFVDNENLPGIKYPKDCIYNAACSGKFLIHNFDITSPALLDACGVKFSGADDNKNSEMSKKNMIPIHVKQGYTKCNTCLIDEDSIITEDKGIAYACLNHGLNVLLISKGFVKLKGFNYGFIGGASGRLGNKIIFNGDLSRHPDFLRIKDFIKSRNLEAIYFKEFPLTDIGSII